MKFCFTWAGLSVSHEDSVCGKGRQSGIIYAMKYLILLFPLLGVLLFSGCRETDVREMTINVPGMTDDADVQRIRKALAPLNGVNKGDAVFDLKGKKIALKYDSMVIAKKNIEIAVAEAGYDANSIGAIKAAPAK